MINSIYTDTPVSPELAERLWAMPKVELHVHLEGATDAATIWELARRNKVKLPASTLEEWQAMYAFRDFSHFVEIYLQAVDCMRTPADFAYMTERFIKQQARHNVKYCETFLSASFMVDKFPHDEIFAALAEGAERGKEEHGVELRFIPDIGRDFPDTARPVLDFVLKGKEYGVFIGLGVGGSEIGFPPELFTDVFMEAQRQGLHVVAHAGETEGPSSIWGALRSLKAERIGHGVRALEDPDLVAYLRHTQIPLEVSPSSNYCLKVVPLDEPHPIRKLMDQGVYVTVNSDDPPMFSTDLSSEYVLLASQGFSWDELWQVNRNALEAAFLTEEARAVYRADWDQFSAQL
ncbi:MAG: adenosine deaminase [Ardenticatenaceae bacterium]|nr:adenosine deaminase [Ardenticatenaceae bacterium]